MSEPSNESATQPSSNVASSAAALRDAVVELNDLVLFGDLDDEARRALTHHVSALTRAHAPVDDGERMPQQSESWRAYRRRSPFAGTANPRAPGLRMLIDPDASAPTAHGSVTAGAAFAGPPGFVHGGIIAGLLDEAIGWLAAATMPDAAVVTGKLSVRFCAPTPVDQPLKLQVTVTRQTSLSMTVAADVSCGDLPTATADALMIVRR